MASRGLRITGGRDHIELRDYRGTGADAGSPEDAARASPFISEIGAVDAGEAGACDGDAFSIAGREAEPIDQQASRSAAATAMEREARRRLPIRLELRTKIDHSIDDRVRELASRLRLAPEIVYRVMRERAYKRFRAIIAADEEVQHGPAPEAGITVRLLMHISPGEMAKLAERFDPLETGKVALALKGPFSRLLTAEVDRLEAAAGSPRNLTRQRQSGVERRLHALRLRDGSGGS